MLIMERKEYIIEARENEVLSGKILTEANIEQFVKAITEYFNIWTNPYKVQVGEYGKTREGQFTFKVITWEDGKK